MYLTDWLIKNIYIATHMEHIFGWVYGLLFFYIAKLVISLLCISKFKFDLSQKFAVQNFVIQSNVVWLAHVQGMHCIHIVHW